MGIDIYLEWDEMSDGERNAQLCGFSIKHGHAGYLREAYHGGPYATRALVREAFEIGHEDGVHIPAAVLRSRVEATVEIAAERTRALYKGEGLSDTVKSFVDFVELAERLEAKGIPTRIIASY